MKAMEIRGQYRRIKNRGPIGRRLLHRIRKTFLMILPLWGIMSVDAIHATENKGNTSVTPDDHYRKNQRMKPEKFKISVDVNLVTTDVTIEGKPLSQLSAEDFILYDNRIAQEVTHFSYDQRPIAVALLIDRSGSVASFFPRLQIASFLALRNLKFEDQVALFSFADSCTQQAGLTTDRLSIAEKISEIQAGGNTNIYGAVQETARYLLYNAPDRRRAIILVSDNRHSGPAPDKKKVLNELMEASVTLYSIRTRPIPRPVSSGSLLVANKEKGRKASTEVTGKWLIKDSNNEIKLDLRVEGTKVTGTLYNSRISESMDIKNGKIEGDKMSFWIERRLNGRKIRIPWAGTLSGNQIKFFREEKLAFQLFLNTNNKAGDHDLKEIVETTGGELLEVNAGTSMQTALSEAIKNIRYRYTLGFSPSDPGEDGGYHTLSVKLATKDRCPECALRTRKGYYAGVAAPILSTKENPPALQVPPEKTDESLIQRSIATAGATQLDLQDVPFTVDTVKQPKQNGQPRLMVQLNIDPAGIGFNTIEDRHVCDLQIAIFYADRSGRVLDYDWKKLKGRFSAEDYKRIINEGIFYTTHYIGQVQEPNLKVVVYDAVNNAIGSKFVPLRGGGIFSSGMSRIQ